jgi:hypothetical protein
MKDNEVIPLDLTKIELSNNSFNIIIKYLIIINLNISQYKYFSLYSTNKNPTIF